MRKWLISHRYAIVIVALIALLFISVCMIAIPHSCIRPPRAVAATPAPPTAAPPPNAVKPSGLCEGMVPPPASKNYAGDGQPELCAAASGVADGPLVACGAGGNLDWSTTANVFQVVCQCTFSVPCDGWAFISAGASLSGRDCEYEAQFRLGIDDTGGDPATDRWVNIYGDAGDGMDADVALSALRPLKGGTHTVYLLVRRSAGTDIVLLHDPSLAVLAAPAAP